MENAADALKIGFAMLVFVSSITAAFFGITLAVDASNTVVRATDITEFFPEVRYVEDGNLYRIIHRADPDDTDNIIMEIHHDGRSRIVGVDELISNLYRYYVENFGIIIRDSHNPPREIARFDLATETNAPWRGNSLRVRQRVEHFINPSISYFTGIGIGGTPTR